VAAYLESGKAGLAGIRAPRGRGTAVDPRWDEAVRLVLAEMASDSTPEPLAVLPRRAFCRRAKIISKYYGHGFTLLSG